MEVVVSAAVLMLVVLGVLAAVDSVTGTAGANKARTVAATLAEKDQEELRSLRAVELNNLSALIPAPRTFEVDGVPYTVTSNAVWVTDTSGEDISCALESGEGSFIRITSTVRSPMTGARVRPVVLSSIVSPQAGSGTLTAMVTNAEGMPVENLPVQAIGPETKTKTTNTAGCAVFGAMEAGSYEVKVNQTNWVDPEGVQEVINVATVAAGTLTTVEFVYDIAASLTVNIATTRAPAPGTTQTDDSYGVIAAHTGILTGSRQFPGTAPSTATTPHVLGGLFPFKDAYKVYSGRCADADPTGFQPTYFDVFTAAAPELDPGESATITIYEPAINVNATFNQPSNSSRVYAYPKAPGCTTPTKMDLGQVVSGRAERPGVPFGTYDVCVQFRRTSNSNWYRRTVTDVANTTSAGTPTMAIPLVSGSSPTTQSQCP